MQLRSLFLCLFPLAICACGSVRHAERAADVVSVPKAFFHAGEQDAAQACHAPNIPLLQSLAHPLAEQNFELAQAAARIREARAAARAEYAARWPSLSATLSASRANSFAAGFDLPPELVEQQGAQTQYRATFAAQWEVDLWGRLSSRGRAAALNLDAVRAQREALLVSLSAELADALSMRLGQHAATQLLRAQLETSEKFLELTRLRYGQGLAPGVDILRQRGQLENVRGELALAEAREAASTARLNVLLGAAEGALPDALPELMPPSAIPASGLPADVIARRPDVAAAYLQLAAADESTAAAVAQRLPGITLSASAFDVRQEFGRLFDNVLWQVMGELAGVLFDAGQLAAAAEQAESRAEQALFGFAQTAVQAVNEVQIALADNLARDTHVQSLEHQTTAARRALASERRLYVAGQRDFLSVLTALQTLQQNERQLIDARVAQIGSRVELCRALGYAVGIDATSTART